MIKLLNKNEINIKEIIGFALAILAISFTQIFAGMLADGGILTPAGLKTIGILVAFLAMLVCESLPIVVVSLLFCGLMPILGVANGLGNALSGYSQPIVFFTLASFGIASALTNVPISRRILKGLLKVFGKNIKTVMLALMVCSALVSSIVSNVPTCAIFMSIALGFLELYDNKEEKKKTGRAFMIAIPVSSMIGGMMTPAGSSINLLAISLLEQQTGETISFVQWMCAGIPLAIVLIPLAWLIITAVYKPVAVDREKIKEFTDKIDVPKKLGAQELKVIVIVAIMLVLWIISSWVKAINVMVVAILGCCVMFLPGIRILNIKDFLRDNSWDAFFLVGAVLSVSQAMITNGVSGAMASLVPTLNVHIIVIIGFVALLIFLALVVIPVATSLIPILCVPLIALAASAGISPALVMMAAALCAGNCYLLPLDTVSLITYSKGYYSMMDMMKSTGILQVVIVILMALWIPVVGLMF